MPVTRLDGPSRQREERAGVTDYFVVGSGFVEVGGSKSDVTLLKLNIHTGRTHQIRSHMKSAGTPVVGDPVYGDPVINGVFSTLAGLNRQFLHAFELVFKHPVTGELLRLNAPLQDDLECALKVSGLASLNR